MEYRRLGNTGLKVSEIALGSMQFGWTANSLDSNKILQTAWESGINFIDTANIYSNWAPHNPGGISEQIIGNWMKKEKIPRDKIVIATKVRGKMGDSPNSQGLSRNHIFEAIEASLLRLQTEYIDLYQAHWFDEDTPIEETLTAFNDLIRVGKVRYIGASNYPVWRFMQSLWVADKLNLTKYISLQPHYNLVNREEFESEFAELCKNFGIGVIPYSPLAGGFLTGKYQKGQNPPDSLRADGAKKRYYNEHSWKILSTVSEIANQRGRSVSQVSLAWLLSNDVVTSPIIGPRNLDQLNDNLGAVGLRLSNEEINKIDKSNN